MVADGLVGGEDAGAVVEAGSDETARVAVVGGLFGSTRTVNAVAAKMAVPTTRPDLSFHRFIDRRTSSASIPTVPPVAVPVAAASASPARPAGAASTELADKAVAIAAALTVRPRLAKILRSFS